jgi:hypothetical protein
MTMRRSGVLDRFKNQGDKTIRSAPPLRANARADDRQVANMTGGSRVDIGPHGRNVVHSKIGDHRAHGPVRHSGSANSSVPPKVQSGRPQQIVMRGGNDEPPEAA